MDLNSLLNEKRFHDKRVSNEYENQPKVNPPIDSGVPCIDGARNRMKITNDINTLDRSFAQAVDSAEGAEIFTVWEKGDIDEWKVILKNKKGDWDEDNKYINAPSNAGFVLGNTVTWKRLNMRWLITWQDYNINEFFRGEMRRANYIISWKNEHGQIKKQWAAVQGPIETRAKYEQTRGNVIVGRQNDTVEIWIGSNEGKEIKELSRFESINIMGRCWRIQVVDNISNPEILRFSCVEDFNNSVTDDMVNLIPGGNTDFAPPQEPIEEVRIVAPGEMREKLISTAYAINEATSEVLLDGSWKLEGNGVITKIEKGIVSIKPNKFGETLILKYIDEDSKEYSVTIKTISMFS